MSKVIWVMCLSLWLATSFAVAAKSEPYSFADIKASYLDGNVALYTKLIHPDCVYDEVMTPKKYEMRRRAISKQPDGGRFDIWSSQEMQEFRDHHGDPFVPEFTVKPTHYLVYVVKPQQPMKLIIALNPIHMSRTGLHILTHGCALIHR